MTTRLVGALLILGVYGANLLLWWVLSPNMRKMISGMGDPQPPSYSAFFLWSDFLHAYPLLGLPPLAALAAFHACQFFYPSPTRGRLAALAALCVGLLFFIQIGFLAFNMPQHGILSMSRHAPPRTNP